MFSNFGGLKIAPETKANKDPGPRPNFGCDRSKHGLCADFRGLLGGPYEQEPNALSTLPSYAPCPMKLAHARRVFFPVFGRDPGRWKSGRFNWAATLPFQHGLWVSATLPKSCVPENAHPSFLGLQRVAAPLVAGRGDDASGPDHKRKPGDSRCRV